MTFVPIDRALEVWVEEELGFVQIVSQYAHDHGCSQLWRLQTERGGRKFFWLKCHQFPVKWAGEVYALTHWTTILNLPSPQVVAFRAEPPAVLLTEMDGVAANTQALEPEREELLWRSAGAYLARLHTIENNWLGASNPDGTPQGEPQHDPVSFVRSSIESRLDQGTALGLFDAAEREFIAYGAKEWPLALANETPRAVHRDYSPRNWMTDTTGQLLAAIDFEQARWDVRAADLTRWWDTDFLGKPHLANAFFSGYSGELPNEALWAQIQALRLLTAASGVVWATRVGDVPYVRTNREALHRLMRESSSGCSSHSIRSYYRNAKLRC